MYNNLFINNTEWKAIGYTRLSNDDRDKDISNSIVNQHSIIERYISKYNDIQLVDIYTDDGYTGTNFNRPAFKKMLKKIESGEINCIIVKDLSRFGRESIEVCTYLQAKFPNLGVRFLSVKENIDSYTQHDRMTGIEIPMLSIIHESYASDTSRKTKLSLNAMKTKGLFVGTTVPYGYLRDKDDKYKLVLDKSTNQNVLLIFQMFINGESMNSIADSLNNKGVLSPLAYAVDIGMRKLPKNANKLIFYLWTSSSIRTVLKNELYTGDMVQGKTTSYSYKVKKRIALPEDKWIIVKKTHDPIITHEMYATVQDMIQKNRKPRPSKEVKASILNGFLYCSSCEKPMVRHVQTQCGKKYFTFCCSSYKRYGKEICTSHRVDENTLIEIVLFAIRSHSAALIDTSNIVDKMSIGKKVAKLTAFYNAEIVSMNIDLEKSNLLLESLYQDYINNILNKNEYKNMSQRTISKVNNIKKNIELTSHKILEAEKLSNEHHDTVKQFLKYGDSNKLTRAMVVSMIDKIIVHEEKNINIIFKYQNQIENFNSIFASMNQN